MNKKKLRELLGTISTDEEKQELQKLDAQKVKDVVKFFDQMETEYEDKYGKLEQTLMASMENYRKSMSKYTQGIMDSFSSLAEGMSKNLEKLGGTITTSYEKNKPVNAAGVYKDMINQLSSIDKNIKEKPVPVWNWPQYAAVSVRNKNFSNINPAIQGFGIEDFDEVQLSNYTGSNVGTVTYLLSGKTTAVLNLTYDGSGNLTDVIRVQ